ncbi:FAD-dependent monooxygenase [Natronosporangium hydrolyticum]|uniref:FAD-dependent monooxygenase n=1 Tax=Natronosporangium hydrolyticum TaxID=2811111 RepID=A0A895Y8E1_9ACTN|nr:NAD(P)/FAD-dependent oxidoreductase [Natronosporangium hydrolyticum]QSB12565.1 FAD-dependent monooxygenase [Natronosporangium hydrolyticum]
MARVKTAAVIGGGIAGPVAALALHRAGIQATIYEAYSTSAEGIGGTIALAPNGVAALEHVGAAAAVVDRALPSPRMVMAIGARKRVPLPSLPDVPPLRLVSRGDLYQAIYDQVAEQQVQVEWGKRLVEVREQRSSVVAIFADGSEAVADVLIGADGVHSTVRRLIDPAAPGPRYTGMLGFEGVAGYEAPVEAGTMTFAFGKRAYYLYWPGVDGGTAWGANLPHPQPMSLLDARAVATDQWLRTLREVYSGDEPGGELAEQTGPDSLQVAGALYLMPPVPRWHRGRLVLVGDAVHAPSNSSGQGASLAIESAVQLARCLRDLDDPAAAFAAYERLRRGRVERVAKRAARTNRVKAPGPIAQAMMAVLMPLFVKSATNFEKTLGPEQRYRIDWDAPVTRDPVLA